MNRYSIRNTLLTKVGQINILGAEYAGMVFLRVYILKHQAADIFRDRLTEFRSAGSHHFFLICTKRNSAAPVIGAVRFIPFSICSLLRFGRRHITLPLPFFSTLHRFQVDIKKNVQNVHFLKCNIV